jgi:hypothetical protein
MLVGVPNNPEGQLPPSLLQMVNSLSADEVKSLLPQLLGLGATPEQPRRPRPSRLREPLEEVFTYRVRVDLHEAKPPIWRRVELASDMPLDVLHRVLQVVMGWTNSHLHGFSSGGDLYSRDAERFLTEYDIAEGDFWDEDDANAVPEVEVRLDQVLQDVGDVLHYEYDFGDSWTHRIRLEAVTRRKDGAPGATCITGRRACPREDVGGIHAYNELVAVLAGDVPADDEVGEHLIWLGPDFDPEHFSVEDVNNRLRFAVLGFADSPAPGGLPAPLAEMLRQLVSDGRPLLEELIARARLDDVPQVGPDVAARMVAPYSWFLRRLGADGVKLTQAGYLPPALVAEVVDALDLDRSWIGAGNREHGAYEVLDFRESAQRLGLVKKRHGRLSPTAAGRRLADDPVALWQHIASRLPLGRDDAERTAGIVALLLAAGEEPLGWQPGDAIGFVLTSLGWLVPGGQAGIWSAFAAASPTWDVLYRTGAVSHQRSDSREDVATPEGRLLARAALRSL